MTKKFQFGLLASVMLLAASCQNDLEPVSPAGDGNVNFSISLPGAVATRSYGDGLTATTLRYVVYEHGSTQAIVDATKTFDEAGGLKTKLSLNLVNGKDYDIVFWAANDNSGHVYNADTQTVTVKYGAVCDENQDAFYKVYNTGVVKSAINTEVTLTRPFAQINFGTDDLSKSIVEKTWGVDATDLQTSLKARAYTTLNLVSGELAGEQEITFSQAPALTGADRAEFGVLGYERIQVAYLLVPADGSLTDVTFNTHIGSGAALPEPVQVTNVPVQANYRTNLYGSLLTNPVDITVVKNPEFLEPGNDIEIVKETVWAGGDESKLADIIAKGGKLTIAAPVAKLDLSTVNPVAPVEIILESPVQTIALNSFDNNVTVNVAKDVDFPKLVMPATANGWFKNFTLTGDVTSSKKMAEVNMGGKHIENVSFINVPFSDRIYGYGNKVMGLTVDGCSFESSRGSLWISKDSGFSDDEQVTVRNCKVVVAAPFDKLNTYSGMYILGMGNITVENCTVSVADGGYIGIFVRPSASAKITGNKVLSAPKDGIKIEGYKGAKDIVVADNEVKCKENGIRLKQPIQAENIAITGNAIDLSEGIAFNETDSEPWSILIISDSQQVSQPLVTVKDNVNVNNNEHWFSIKNVTPAAGSVIPN